MDAFKKNLSEVATTEGDFNEQKEKLQEEAQMGETAAHIAAKAPVSPETVIEGIMMWRRIRDSIKDYAVPALAVTFSVIAAVAAYEVYAHKSQEK